jgi:hypothetical protein
VFLLCFELLFQVYSTSFDTYFIYTHSFRFRWVVYQLDALCEEPNDKARLKAVDTFPQKLEVA